MINCFKTIIANQLQMFPKFQTEIILKDADPALISQITSLVAASGASLVRTGKPRTTLERLFLRETQNTDER